MRVRRRLLSGKGPARVFACVCLLLGPLVAAWGAQAGSGDATAFIRVFGDLHAEFTRIWQQPIERQSVEVATGRGLVIGPSGMILASHRLADDAPQVRTLEAGEVGLRFDGEEAEVTVDIRRVEVSLEGGETAGVFEGHVVVTDPDLGLAVLQVTAFDLPYVRFGDSGARDATEFNWEIGQDDAGEGAEDPIDLAVDMVDEDGYALAVGSVPINRVKDFLDAHGLLGQIPVERLLPGVVNTLEWKGLRVELPDGFGDSSLVRLLVDTGESGSAMSLRLGRVATPWKLGPLEQRLLQGGAWPGFVPAPALEVRQSSAGRGRVLGSAFGETGDGSPFRVEYALVDMGSEKIVARYLGPPDDVAFNLSLVRRSLKTLQAAPLLTAPVKAPLGAAFEPADLPGGATGGVPLPAAWVREPAAYASCTRVPVAEAGVAASPQGDFTVIFRALRWGGAAIVPEDVARACGQASGTTGARYAGRFERLGVGIGVWGTFVRRPGEVLLLEAEAPEEKLPFVRDLYVEWLRRFTGSD